MNRACTGKRVREKGVDSRSRDFGEGKGSCVWGLQGSRLDCGDQLQQH